MKDRYKCKAKARRQRYGPTGQRLTIQQSIIQLLDWRLYGYTVQTNLTSQERTRDAFRPECHIWFCARRRAPRAGGSTRHAAGPPARASASARAARGSAPL